MRQLIVSTSPAQPRRRIRSAARRIGAAALLCTVVLVASPAPARAAVTANPVVTGLATPTAFTFAPGGTIFYVEKNTGEIRTYDPASDVDQLFATISGVDGSGERGMLGIALHPDYPARPFVYVYATRMSGGSLKNQIVRLTDSSGSGTDARTIFSAPAASHPYHNGGRILFGPDRMLYAIVGDGHRAANSQDLTDPRGKILRMTPLGKVPPDNPLPHSRIFAYGIRNSFGFAFDPMTGTLWETDNGPGCNDELNAIPRGGKNYGWGPRQSCGSLPAPRDTNNSGPKPRIRPELWFTTTIGITGMTFCNGCGLSGFDGDVFFGDVNDGQIRRVPLNVDRTTVSGTGTVVLDTGSVLSMETGPDGAIYYSDFSGIYTLVAS
jgi:aldose sugar dehydrogenase